MAGTFTLYVNTSSVSNIDCQPMTMPVNFNLSMKSRTRHTKQNMTVAEDGVEGANELCARPTAGHCTMGGVAGSAGCSTFIGPRGKVVMTRPDDGGVVGRRGMGGGPGAESGAGPGRTVPML